MGLSSARFCGRQLSSPSLSQFWVLFLAVFLFPVLPSYTVQARDSGSRVCPSGLRKCSSRLSPARRPWSGVLIRILSRVNPYHDLLHNNALGLHNNALGLHNNARFSCVSFLLNLDSA